MCSHNGVTHIANGKFFGLWSCKEDVLKGFSTNGWIGNKHTTTPPDAEPGDRILAAFYTKEDYSGSAAVLLRRDGDLYEVYGSHCSCYGLEGQWSPEKSVPAELLARAEREIAADNWRRSSLEKEYWSEVRKIVRREIKLKG